MVSEEQRNAIKDRFGKDVVDLIYEDCVVDNELDLAATVEILFSTIAALVARQVREKDRPLEFIYVVAQYENSFDNLMGQFMEEADADIQP